MPLAMLLDLQEMFDYLTDACEVISRSYLNGKTSDNNIHGTGISPKLVKKARV